MDSMKHKVGPISRVCCIKENIARVVVEEGVVVVYHCMDNAREKFASPLSPLEFDLDDGPAIELLLSTTSESSSGRGIAVSDLPHTSEEIHDKIAIADSLFKEGLVYIVDDDFSFGSKSSNSKDKEKKEDTPNNTTSSNKKKKLSMFGDDKDVDKTEGPANKKIKTTPTHGKIKMNLDLSDDDDAPF